MKKKLSLLFMLMILTSAFGALLAGCGSKEETTNSKDSSYYTGPVKAKGSGAAQDNAAKGKE